MGARTHDHARGPETNHGCSGCSASQDRPPSAPARPWPPGSQEAFCSRKVCSHVVAQGCCQASAPGSGERVLLPSSPPPRCVTVSEGLHLGPSVCSPGPWAQGRAALALGPPLSRAHPPVPQSTASRLPPSPSSASASSSWGPPARFCPSRRSGTTC